MFGIGEYADASEVTVFHNFFDMNCQVPAIAIINLDPDHCLMATNNYYSQPDGPSSYNFDTGEINGPVKVVDCMTGELADGLGSQIVVGNGIGPVAFDKWLGLNAVAKINGLYDNVIYAKVGEPVMLDASESWAKDFTGVFDPIYFWDKGDGYYSMEKAISHIYTAPGTYHGYIRVHMLGIPEFGIPPLYEWDYFTVIVSSPGAPLAANAGGGSLGYYEVSIGQYLTLSGSASGGTPPYTYQWDLGDGRTVDGQNPTVLYNAEDKDNPQSATYTVTLTVIDGNYDTATDTVTINVLAPDQLNVIVNTPANAMTGMPAVFTSKVTGGASPYSYEWDFGDNTDHNIAPNPVHTFVYSGVYTVTVTVTDSEGETKTVTSTVTVGVGEGSSSEIKEVKGGFRVTAKIASGDSECHWSINVNGNFVLSGGEGSGIIAANTEETVRLPLTFAFGKVDITVTANSIQKQYTAFALGPLFLNVQEI